MERNRGLLIGGIISAVFAIGKLCGVNISWAMVIAPLAAIAGVELALAALLLIVVTLRVILERRLQRHEETKNERER